MSTGAPRATASSSPTSRGLSHPGVSAAPFPQAPGHSHTARAAREHRWGWAVPSVLTLQIPVHPDLRLRDSRPDPDLPPNSRRDPQVPPAAGSAMLIYSPSG